MTAGPGAAPTRDVVLRPQSLTDEREFLTLVEASRDLHHPWVEPPRTPSAYRFWQQRNSRPDYVGLFACDADSGAIVGTFNISQIFRGGFCNCVLGYYGFAPTTGQGWVSAGLRAVCDLTFGELGLHRMEVNVQPGNERSIALATAVGFRYEGFSPRYLRVLGDWRDHNRYALTAEEWPSASRARTT